MSIIWTKGVETGLISPSDFVRVTSTNAAKIFNMYPKKGIIQPGSDADIVLWDPTEKKTISHKCHNHNYDFNIFEGIEVKGLPTKTFVRGKLVYEKGQQLKTE
jgi:dihydropyrimidinase